MSEQFNTTPPADEARYVERVREGERFVAKWRVSLIVLHAIGLLALVVAFAFAVRSITRSNWEGIGMGFVVGLASGAMLGMIFLVALNGLFQAIAAGGRSQRLMLKYYDALYRPTGEAESPRPQG